MVTATVMKVCEQGDGSPHVSWLRKEIEHYKATNRPERAAMMTQLLHRVEAANTPLDPRARKDRRVYYIDSPKTYSGDVTRRSLNPTRLDRDRLPTVAAGKDLQDSHPGRW